jgi:23S rRNA pseudouridine1911/1915/1917 synthase
MVIEEPLENYSANGGPAAPVRLVVPDACAGLRLDQALSRMFPQYSRTRLARWVLAARVTVDGRPSAPRQRLLGGENVALLPAPDLRLEPDRPEDMPLAIVHEDDALIVIDKPAGLVVHPGAANWSGTLLNALLAHEPGLRAVPRAGIVHRLDKDTSGLLVVARTLEAQTDLVRQLAARSVRREYLAIVHGRVASDGTVAAPIGRHPRSRTRMAVVARGRDAVTHYRVLERFTAATVLRCRLETGRTHQIRVHLNSLGYPLVGDPTYGKRVSAIRFTRQALHAERLALTHPRSGKKMSWQSDPPADMQQLLERLRDEGAPSHPSSFIPHPSRGHRR